jgi:hypothetical protein
MKRIEKLRRSRADDEKTECSVLDCSEESKRSLSTKKVENALPNLKLQASGKKVHLCRIHYKQFKKATKQQRKIETLTWE